MRLALGFGKLFSALYQCWNSSLLKKRILPNSSHYWICAICSLLGWRSSHVISRVVEKHSPHTHTKAKALQSDCDALGNIWLPQEKGKENKANLGNAETRILWLVLFPHTVRKQRVIVCSEQCRCNPPPTPLADKGVVTNWLQSLT